MHNDAERARERYLDGKSPEDQARIVRHAEKVGPLPTDPDWLIAYAATEAVEHIRASAAEVSSAASLTERTANRIAELAAPKVVEKMYGRVHWVATILPFCVALIVALILVVCAFRVGVAVGTGDFANALHHR